MTAEEAEAAYGTVLRKVYAVQDEEVDRMLDKPPSTLTNGAPEPWPEGKVPTVEWVDTRPPGRLERRLKIFANLLHEELLTEAQVAKELRRLLDRLVPQEPVPVVERTLCCRTCRREFCRVQAPVDAWVAPVCEGCQREGRVG